jgi:antiphage defense system Thoeris ThsB-like protein
MAARVFISFAAEDARMRDLFVGQMKLEDSPIEFVDFSVKEPWDEKWKTNCRTRIKGCDALIALLSKKTWNATGARWEMQCADEEGIPILGVHIHADDKGAIPPELVGHKVIEWTWAGIKAFLNRL